MTQTDLIYMAGFFDGEGCIRIEKGRSQRDPNCQYKLVLQIAQKDSGALEYWRDLMGLGVINSKGNRQHGCSEWRIMTREALHFLEMIRPWLLLKAEQADWAIAFGTHKARRGCARLARWEIDWYEDIRVRLQMLKRTPSRIEGR